MPPSSETRDEVGTSRLRVRVASDGFSASVSVRAGPPVSEQELRDALEAAGIRAGIDPSAYAELARGLGEATFTSAERVIARGEPAQDGEDGSFEPRFRPGIQPGHLRDDGTVDFHDRELLKPVAPGDVLGRLHPSRPGVPGYLVDGSALTAKATKEARLALGPGVERDADGLVRATRAGVVDSNDPQALRVVEHHEHHGAVDLRSGHLHMQGSLVVKGDVERAFSVYATGDIEIRGSVDCGTVHAGGDLRVQRGVRGGAGGVVRAEGNLAVHHAESATLHAGHLLQLGEALHSLLTAERVEVSGKLRGGLAQAELSIVAREVGSPQGTDTELAVAEPLEHPLETAQRALERAKALRFAARGPRAMPNERVKGGKLARAQAALASVDVEALAERARRRLALSRVAFVQVGLAHPGTTVRIAGRTLAFTQDTRASRVSLDLETSELRVDKISR